MEEEEPDLQTIAPSKLLNYVTKPELQAFISVPKYAQLEMELRKSLGKDRINLKDIKQ